MLEQTFILRTLPPLEANLGKRLVKSPKLYLRDSGLLHALLGLENDDDLAGHPVYGPSWEGFAIEQILAMASSFHASFFRTATGDELDLVLEKGRRRIAIECKAGSSPTVTRGFWSAIKILGIREAYVVANVRSAYPLGQGVEVIPLGDLPKRL